MPTATTDTTLGRVLRGARIGLDITQKRLGAAVGTTQSTVAAWESGKVELNLFQLLACAKALNIDPSGLLSAAAADHSDKLDRVVQANLVDA